MRNRILVTVLLLGLVAIAALSQWNRSSRGDIVRCEECMRLPDLQRYVDLAPGFSGTKARLGGRERPTG